MGICGSKLSEEQRLSNKLDYTDEYRDEQASKVKLLLLGAGESGKSTIFKQMKIIYGVGFNEEDRKATVPIIFSNVISSMQNLLAATDTLGIPVAAVDEKDYVAALDADEETVEGKTAEAIKTLWADDGIQDAYSQRAKFQLFDSAAYYLNKIDEISAPGYIASKEDLLKSRVRTSGIVEEAYRISGVNFVMYDVGGQRNERKKWIHCFDDVTAVIFVASLSEYDQSLYEDAKVNRMDEAVTLFTDIVNSRWFKNTSMILFLNKRDLFEEKICKVDIKSEGVAGYRDRFLDYDGGACTCSQEEIESNRVTDTEALDYGVSRCPCGAQQAAREYILEMFLAKSTKESPIYNRVTCATDTKNVEFVFSACKDIILDANLRGSGFMD